ncbi:IucA/IucC family protein [Chitinimonas sp.]|uniref:IucA/IucC family protein n=1 Tax=Chitinimonas sp. TaxID=1934313 RepID=UPI002F928ADF
MNPTTPVPAELWRRANIRMVEKALSELSYEGLLSPKLEAADEHGHGRFVLSSSLGGYHWQGHGNCWGQPVITPDSVRHALTQEPVHDALALLADVLGPLEIPPATLANYLRETLNTLQADVAMLAERKGLTAQDWLVLPAERLQSLLDGHPKALPAKGRVGWGTEDNLRYGPEHAPAFRPHWLAVHRELAQPVCAEGWDADRLLAASCDAAEQVRLHTLLATETSRPADYWLLPVHPWQWQAMIAPQFAGLLAEQKLIWLGEGGDRYTPQQSLRTLSNVDRPKEPNLKLTLTLLNTSAYRGLPERYLVITPALSSWLGGLITGDALLRDCNTQALAEPATAYIAHPLYHALPGVPYQFDEILGAVWREGTERHRQDGEQILMAAVLQQCDDQGRPLAGEMIKASGLDAASWLSRLFDLTVVPLYHLQAKHGLGFIAHGQNLMLRFKQGAPAGILLKDYQGDLFRAETDWAKPQGLDEAVWQALPTMPPHYLVHNLWTGLFASVFRFMATELDRAGLYREPDFYRLLAGRLRQYQSEHPELILRFAELDLFNPSMPRLSLNRARFAAGYGDAASRPIHALGPALPNPLLGTL